MRLHCTKALSNQASFLAPDWSLLLRSPESQRLAWFSNNLSSSPGELPDPRKQLRPPSFQVDSLPAELPWEAPVSGKHLYFWTFRGPRLTHTCALIPACTLPVPFPLCFHALPHGALPHSSLQEADLKQFCLFSLLQISGPKIFARKTFLETGAKWTLFTNRC